MLLRGCGNEVVNLFNNLNLLFHKIRPFNLFLWLLHIFELEQDFQHFWIKIDAKVVCSTKFPVR